MHRSALKTLFSLLIAVAIISPGLASADTLFISPLSGTYGVGESFSVRVMASSPRQSINAISGVLSFPTDKLQVTSISKIGSVLSLWVQEPTFSNSRGTVSFEGVVPNPGFSESNGRVLSVNFRVVGTGAADLRLSSGTLLANDGYGTNILKTLGSATYTFEQRQQQLPVTPPAVLETSEDAEGEVDQAPPPEIVKFEKSKDVSFDLPAWETVWAILFKFFSIAIPLIALIFLLIQLLGKGVQNVRSMRKHLRKDLHNIDRLVEKSFDLIKEDISESIHVLERARTRRRLTAEEDAIIHRLRQNLVDAEKIIHQEVLQAEKDIGD